MSEEEKDKLLKKLRLWLILHPEYDKELVLRRCNAMNWRCPHYYEKIGEMYTCEKNNQIKLLSNINLTSCIESKSCISHNDFYCVDWIKDV